MTQTRTDHWAKMKHTATNFVVKMPEAVVITKRKLVDKLKNLSRIDLILPKNPRMKLLSPFSPPLLLLSINFSILCAGAPRTKRGPDNSLNIGPPYILIQRNKPHVLVFHLITQRCKHNKTFQNDNFTLNSDNYRKGCWGEAKPPPLKNFYIVNQNMQF